MNKSTRKRCVHIIVIIMLMIRITALPAEANDSGKTAMQKYVEALAPGWNLGNTFDAIGGETAWGNPLTTKEMIDAIAESGFKSIRIPITWKHYMGNAPDYTIRPEALKRIQEVIDWSLEAGLYVMINLHHDSDWIMKMETDYDHVIGRYNAAWTQIAGHFKEYPHTLLFESINEPRFSHDWNEDKSQYFEMLEELNLSFHRIVRQPGGKNKTRPLVLPTVATSPSENRMNKLRKTIDDLKDKNLIATIHYYGFWPFSVNVAGFTTFNQEVADDIVRNFNNIHKTFVAHGIPVVVGEYGLLGFDRSLGTIQHGEIIKFFEYVNYYGHEKGLTMMLWDNGQHFNRRTLTWRDEQLLRVIQSSTGGRSSTAETDSVFIKKGQDRFMHNLV